MKAKVIEHVFSFFSTASIVPCVKHVIPFAKQVGITKICKKILTVLNIKP